MYLLQNYCYFFSLFASPGSYFQASFTRLELSGVQLSITFAIIKPERGPSCLLKLLIIKLILGYLFIPEVLVIFLFASPGSYFQASTTQK